MSEPEILGAIVENGTGAIAADGRATPPTAMTSGQVIDMLEDGQFSEELHRDITDLIADMNDLSGLTGNKVKGEVTITMKFEKEDNAFRVSAGKKVVKPARKRPRSVMWCDEHNRLTRFPPNQHQLFGLKSAGGTTGPLKSV